MDRAALFDRNLLALSSKAPELCSMLSNAETTKGYYTLVYSRNKLPVPALTMPEGAPRPLHSLFDPHKEAERIVATAEKSGYIIMLGLGGGYLAQKALERSDIHSVIIVDYNLDGCAELLSLIDYISIFSDPRVSLLINPSQDFLYHFILSTYKPALHGGIQVLPLRPRVDHEPELFKAASDIIRSSIDAISEDYSVQAYFGRTWFSNTIRNIFSSEHQSKVFSFPDHVSVTAAGPSLDMQITLLKQEREHTFILATDTSLPALAAHGIEPDGVISIDCQHISYYHFVAKKPQDIPLFVDLSSPPVVATLSENTLFFSGGHPLTQYVSQYWRSFPLVDTSGGNVTYAAVALANQLGARTIRLYGADYSYPEGESYARGTYIHGLFHCKQDRLHPVESLFSSFLFRNSQLLKIISEQSWRYETKPLISYRKKLEALSEQLQAQLIILDGRGAPIRVPQKQQVPPYKNIKPLFTAGKARESAASFLQSYVATIKGLPKFQYSLNQYVLQLTEHQRDVFTTLLPLAAFIRRSYQDISLESLINRVKETAIAEIEPFISPKTR
ncbi:MAG TPA: DUF115 domain-containing protein [Treponema sp.]|nr:DUF115 domain-containing protein [Treponema sp.]